MQARGRSLDISPVLSPRLVSGYEKHAAYVWILARFFRRVLFRGMQARGLRLGSSPILSPRPVLGYESTRIKSGH